MIVHTTRVHPDITAAARRRQWLDSLSVTASMLVLLLILCLPMLRP